MIEIAPGWGIDVERGPDWLFVHVTGQINSNVCDIPLADAVWSLLEQHFTHRVVLELDDTPILFSQIIGELVQLQKRVHSNGGLLRLCGVSEAAQESLKTARLTGGLPCFADRSAAVMGDRPRQPR
jgi:anti-anti-sigma regulatory factor